MVAYHRSSALHAYVLAVSAVGLCLVALLVVVQGPTTVLRQPPLFWVLLASLVVMLLVNVFVMLAEERKGELGMPPTAF